MSSFSLPKFSRTEVKMINPNYISDKAGLLQAITEIQEIFAVHREHPITSEAMSGVYEALGWCLQNFNLDEGTQSYIRGNLNAVGGGDREKPLSGTVAWKLEESRKRTETRGGEVEYALRSIMQILKMGELRTSEKTMLTELKNYLSKIIDESNGAPRVE